MQVLHPLTPILSGQFTRCRGMHAAYWPLLGRHHPEGRGVGEIIDACHGCTRVLGCGPSFAKVATEPIERLQSVLSAR
jgi:hypothetical protein